MAFLGVALIVQLGPNLTASASAASALTLFYPHLLYIVVMRTTRGVLSVGAALAMDSTLIGLIAGQAWMSSNIAVLMIVLMFLTVAICVPYRSAWFLSNALVLGIALSYQWEWLRSTWDVLTITETLMISLTLLYLISVSLLACGWAMRLGQRRRQAEVKRHQLLDDHAEVIKFLPDRHLLREVPRTHQSTHLIVLFSDMCRFTAWSNGLPGPVLANWLNTYLDTVAAMVAEAGGVLDKFTGDGLMVIFAAPQFDRCQQRSQANAAIRLASRLHQLHNGSPTVEIATFNRLLALGSSELPALRIGIHAGEGLLGRFGGQVRSHFTAAGTTINVASRLCDAALEGGTLVSDRIGQLANGVLASAEWFSFQPRGLETKMMVSHLGPPEAV